MPERHVPFLVLLCIVFVLATPVARADEIRGEHAERTLEIYRSIVEVDTSLHQADWDAVMRKARENLAGRVYSKSLLEAAERAAAGE
jgi:hypothetical protein